MSKFELNIKAIQESIYGKDVRDNIVNALKECYDSFNSECADYIQELIKDDPSVLIKGISAISEATINDICV